MSLVTLRYYFESINSSREIESVLLIDEIDASLHPAYQFKLLDLLQEYSETYRIQVFFTTHSYTLLEESFKRKNEDSICITYLVDEITSVFPLPDPDMDDVRMNMENLYYEELHLPNQIPIFTEDDEARLFLEVLMENYEKKNQVEISGLFHIVSANISSENLCTIFNDSKLLRTTMKSVCLLDGDKHSSTNLENCIISLPGKDSPESLIFRYANEVYESNLDFWRNPTVRRTGITKAKYNSEIKNEIESIEVKIQEAKDNGISTKGLRRDLNKKLFKKHTLFFRLLLSEWIIDKSNLTEVKSFYENLKIMFYKCLHYMEHVNVTVQHMKRVNKMVLYSPLRYPGGKAKLYNFMVELIDENFAIPPIYIEPFAGGCGLALKLLLNEKVDKIVINDNDHAIHSFWYSIMHRTDAFLSLLKECPFSISYWKEQKIYI